MKVSEDVKFWAEAADGTVRFYDEQQRMHNREGPALIQKSGEEGFYYHGIWQKGVKDEY